MANVLSVVRVVQVLQEAKQRIPPPLHDWTFFAASDHWLYHLDLKPTTCDVCIAFAQAPYYRGNDLRGLFPDLDIVDMYRMQVNIHPHCGCWLERDTEHD